MHTLLQVNCAVTFHGTDLFVHLLKNKKNRFPDVFRGCRKKPSYLGDGINTSTISTF